MRSEAFVKIEPVSHNLSRSKHMQGGMLTQGSTIQQHYHYHHHSFPYCLLLFYKVFSSVDVIYHQ